MNEADIMRSCMIEASSLGATVWRNNIGAYKDSRGIFVKYGVCNPGGSDLIGLYQGKFLGIEIKAQGKKPTPEQVNFLSFVHKNGGLAGVCRCKEDVKKVLDGQLIL